MTSDRDYLRAALGSIIERLDEAARGLRGDNGFITLPRPDDLERCAQALRIIVQGDDAPESGPCAPRPAAEMLSEYLERQGWHRADSLPGRCDIWHRQDNDRAEIVVPHSAVRDHRARLRDAFVDLAAFERRPLVDVIVDCLEMQGEVAEGVAQGAPRARAWG